MTLEHLEVVAQDGVAQVTLARPERFNAIGTPLLTELRMVLADLSSDDELRSLVITGSGRAFSAGADIAEMTAMAGRSDFRRFLELIQGTWFVGHVRALVNLANGLGLGTDDWQLTDAGTGQVIVEGSARATVQRASQVKGLTMGRFPQTGERFIATGSWGIVPIGAVLKAAPSPAVVTLGADVPANPSDASLVVDGVCTEEFDTFFWGWHPG